MRRIDDPLTERGPPIPPLAAALMSRYPEFTRRLAAALHEEGVPLLAGTDVYGVPMLIPGRSRQQEVRYLERCGLSPEACSGNCEGENILSVTATISLSRD